MSMSNGNPPVGTGYGFDYEDPAEPVAARRAAGRKEARDRFGTLDRELPAEPMDPEQKAEEIVVREQGVSSFADTEEVDRMERPSSVHDHETDRGDNIISDTVRGAWGAVAGDDGARENRR